MLVLSYDLPTRLGAVGFCFVLAALMYHFVDLPVRRGAILASNRWLVTSYALVTAGLLAGLVFMRDGLPQRFSPPALALANANSDADDRFRKCEKQTKNPCVIGAKGKAADLAGLRRFSR